MCHVVGILDAHYLCNALSLSQLLGSNVAQTDVTDQSLTLELGEHGQRFLNGSSRRFDHCANPKIDDIKTVNTEVSKVVMNAIDKLLGAPLTYALGIVGGKEHEARTCPHPDERPPC